MSGQPSEGTTHGGHSRLVYVGIPGLLFRNYREVTTFKDVLKLPVANQLKANMFEEAVKYVTLREGEIWSSVAELTKHLKTFEEAEVKGSASRQLDILNVVREKQSDHRLNSKAAGAQKRETPKGFALPKNGQRGGCFECGSTKYYEANCPHAHTKGPGKEDWRKKEKKPYGARGDGIANPPFAEDVVLLPGSF